MDKEEICRDYMVLTEKIAEEYRDRHVPNAVQSYYLLCELIASGSLSSFIRTYGRHRIEAKIANDGKQRLNLGDLSDFEVSAVEILNEALDSH